MIFRRPLSLKNLTIIFLSYTNSSQIFPLTLALIVDQVSLYGNFRLTPVNTFFFFFCAEGSQTAYCLAGALTCLFLSSGAYQSSWITLSFANTNFKTAATSPFSYQKEAEAFQMSQKQLGILQHRPFGGNKDSSFTKFLICLFCLLKNLTKRVSVIWFTASSTSIFGSTIKWTGTSSQTGDIFNWFHYWRTYFRTIH